MTITKSQAIEYFNSLGDPVEELEFLTLKQIRDEVLRGDAYDGMNLWAQCLETYNAEDIQEDN